MAPTPFFNFAGLRCDSLQASAYWHWALDQGMIDECCRRTVSIRSSNCWADWTEFNDPVTDNAPWLDEQYPESSEFLGVLVVDVEGLDDPIRKRASYASTDGGSTLGPVTSAGRGVRARVVLLGATREGLAWGKAWFGRMMMGRSGALTVRAACPSVDELRYGVGLVRCYGVSVVEEPAYTPLRDDPSKCGCEQMLALATIDFIATDPALYTIDGTPVVDTLTATTTTVTVADVVCPAPATLDLTDPSAPAPVVVMPVSTLASFDDEGRPSCGPDSGYYGSGSEQVWFDLFGRPASGDGSGHYLDEPDERPEFDAYGIPSCGSRSGSYGAYPAAAAQDVVGNVLSTVSTAWADHSFTIEGLTPLQLESLVVTLRPTAGAQVQAIARQVFYRNDYASPSRRDASGLVVVKPGQTSSPVQFKASGYSPPAGWVADVVVEWQARVPAGSVELRYTTDEVDAVAGPHGGTWLSVDAYGRPSCGPGSGNYGDEVIVYDAHSIPSCGPGSANYGVEDPVLDAYGRPSCGDDSGAYQSEVSMDDWLGRNSCGADSANWLKIDASAGLTASLPPSLVPDTITTNTTSNGGCPIAASAWNASKITVSSASNANVKIWSIVVHYYTTAGVLRSGVLLFNSPGAGGFVTSDIPFPQLPGDALVVTAYTLTYANSAGSGGGASITQGLWIEGHELIPSPNGGTDRPCTIGPNGGVDRPCDESPNGGTDRDCDEGPNGGVDVSCEGTDTSCAQGAPGPNAGTDRPTAEQCVTSITLRPTTFTGGWPSARAYGGSGLPHTGHEATVIAALQDGEGAGLPGLEGPGGSFLFELGGFLPLDAVCDDTTILSARLVAKLTRPSSNVSTWRGWTLAAVDPPFELDNADLEDWTAGLPDGGWVNEDDIVVAERGLAGDRYMGLKGGNPFSWSNLRLDVHDGVPGSPVSFAFLAYGQVPGMTLYAGFTAEGDGPDMSWNGTEWWTGGAMQTFSNLPLTPTLFEINTPPMPDGYVINALRLAVTDMDHEVYVGHLRLGLGTIADALLGGEMDTTSGAIDDDDGYVRWPVKISASSQLSQLVVLGQLGVPVGGKSGFLDEVRIEVQAIGGPECLDCGPNAGVDVECGSSLLRSGQWAEPSAVRAACGEAAAPPGHELVPTITVTTGPTALRNTRVRFWEAAGCSDTLRCGDADAVLELPYLPANAVLVIDGPARTALITIGDVTVDASSLVYGASGAAWSWPAFGSFAVLIDQDDSGAGDASVAVAATARKWQT